MTELFRLVNYYNLPIYKYIYILYGHIYIRISRNNIDMNISMYGIYTSNILFNIQYTCHIMSNISSLSMTSPQDTSILHWDLREPCDGTWASIAFAWDGGWKTSRAIEEWMVGLLVNKSPSNYTGWCPPVISWFINPINYSYICHKP